MSNSLLETIYSLRIHDAANKVVCYYKFVDIRKFVNVREFTRMKFIKFECSRGLTSYCTCIDVVRVWHRRMGEKKMAVIENGRSSRRKNGMANIFTGIDIAAIEYLSSLAAAASTSSVPNTTGADALEISHSVASLNSEDSQHSADNTNDRDGDDGDNNDDVHDDR